MSSDNQETGNSTVFTGFGISLYALAAGLLMFYPTGQANRGDKLAASGNQAVSHKAAPSRC
jgi:hypothetical protein